MDKQGHIVLLEIDPPTIKSEGVQNEFQCTAKAVYKDGSKKLVIAKFKVISTTEV